MVAYSPLAHLPELVATRFAKALADGELHYFPTQVALLPAGPVRFQLRFAPSLADKPKRAVSSSTRDADTPANPFANPSPTLFITDVGTSHYLVLNKFAVVPGHFILATRAFRQQEHVLEEADLDAVLCCMDAYEGSGRDGLFGFFNSGVHSGASQPHRHIQLLPVDQMRLGLGPEAQTWRVLAGTAELEAAPFVVFSADVRPGISASEAHAAYLGLYRRAVRAVRRHGGDARPGQGDAPAEGPALISYNLALTRERMVLCPRLAEGGPVLDGNGEEVGRLGLNGTLLAGTALVKSEAEWDALRTRPAGLLDVLRTVGIPRETGGGELDGLDGEGQ